MSRRAKQLLRMIVLRIIILLFLNLQAEAFIVHPSDIRVRLLPTPEPDARMVEIEVYSTVGTSGEGRFVKFAQVEANVHIMI